MCFFMILAYVTTFGLSSNTQGINFVINEGLAIGRQLWPVVGNLFLLMIGIMLFQTQLGILDSTSRIMAENLALKRSGPGNEIKVNLSRIYHTFLWLQIAFGLILFAFNIYEPKTLIVLGAVINAFSMFIHIALVNLMNRRVLAKIFQPSLLRKLVLILAFVFFGVFSLLILWEKLF